MAARGVKPKPAALRLVSGTPESRVNKHEPVVQRVLDAAPDWFDKEQKAVWDRVITDAPVAMLRGLDQDSLACYCVAVVAHRKAVQALRRNATWMIITTNGNVVQDPNVGMMNRQALIITKIASELGFSPTSRARIKAPAGNKGNENPFAAHAAKKR